MVDILSDSVSRDDTRCEGGKLKASGTLAFVDELFRADRNLNHTFLLFNLSNNERHRLAWSDSVAFGMESLTCGDRLKKFNTTVMLFGNDG